MTYQELQKEAGIYRGALITERLISGQRLHLLEKILRVLLVCAFFLGVVFFFATVVPFLRTSFPIFTLFAASYAPLAKNLFLTLLAFWLVPALWYGFFASYYFKDADTILLESGMKLPRLRYEAAKIVSQGLPDPLLDFLAAPYGGAVLTRLGVDTKELMLFLQSRSMPTAEFDLATHDGEVVGLEQFAKALLDYDEGFKRFLGAQTIEASDFVGAAAWVSHNEEDYKSYLRWWSKDSLGRIPGIGKDWGYGEIPLLQKYAIDITLHPAFSSGIKGAFGKNEADEIERVLSRGREANVMLVGEEGVPKLAPLCRLARRISAGTVLPPLEHKRLFVFDGVPFASALKEKTAFETELMRLLSEAAQAGNIIFVFDKFDVFFESAKGLGSNLLSLLDPFFISTNVQIAAVTEAGAFHQLFESNAKVRERFERVFIEGAGVAGSLPILEEEAIRVEAQEGLFFTYPTIRTVAESADRYFFEGVMPDKALDLLLELVPMIKNEHKRIVVREDVLRLVSQKTGIAISEAKGEERSKLLKLEEILHERIVGQDEAVKAISGALRRARSGISSTNRPMGSFLFIGPTGVGKTETTKALAQAFFGDEKNITRLDMSEYQSDDALSRLIGTFESGKAGILASLLREHPYGVLLLDEFEKTSREVHDLFLQILDEGFFTDVSGKRVNARNLIIIATSNAGSDMIWKLMSAQGGSASGGEEGKAVSKDNIITEIINRAIFKPELLNRFDGVILFHPLDAANLRVIAKLMLQKLAKRLTEKGVELVITDVLLDYLVSVGQDPKFGARPMNRAIQEKVEQAIADKMLKGEVSAGSRVELTASELA